MTKIIAVVISLFLIGIIFLRLPQDNVGLASFGAKTNLLGSPKSTERLLNIITGVGIFLYFVTALQLNFLNI